MQKIKNFFEVIFGQAIEWTDLTEAQQAAVLEVVRSLGSWREKLVTQYFGLGCECVSSAQLAEQFGVLVSRISAIRRRTVRDLQSPSHVRALKVALGLELPMPAVSQTVAAGLHTQVAWAKRDLEQAATRLQYLLRQALQGAGQGGLLFAPLAELELSVRTYNLLKNAGLSSLEEVLPLSEAELLKNKNFGRRSLNEIKDLLAELGLKLAEPLGEQPTAAAVPRLLAQAERFLACQLGEEIEK